MEAKSSTGERIKGRGSGKEDGFLQVLLQNIRYRRLLVSGDLAKIAIFMFQKESVVSNRRCHSPTIKTIGSKLGLSLFITPFNIMCTKKKLTHLCANIVILHGNLLY